MCGVLYCDEAFLSLVCLVHLILEDRFTDLVALYLAAPNAAACYALVLEDLALHKRVQLAIDVVGLLLEIEDEGINVPFRAYLSSS